MQMIEAVLLAANETAPTLGGLLTALNLGLAGVGIFAYHKRWIVPGGTYNESKEREQHTAEELAALRTKVEDQILPELIKARESQIRVASTMDRFIRFVERTQSRGDE